MNCQAQKVVVSSTKCWRPVTSGVLQELILVSILFEVFIKEPGDHRIIECFELEGTFRGHLAQPPCSEQGYLQPEQVAQSPIQPDLECFQGWDLHYLSGHLFQCFITLIVKNVFPASSLNLPSLSLKPLLLVSQQASSFAKKAFTTFPLGPLQVLKGCSKSPCSLLLSSSLMNNWKEYTVHQMGLLPFRGTWTGWRNWTTGVP